MIHTRIHVEFAKRYLIVIGIVGFLICACNRIPSRSVNKQPTTEIALPTPDTIILSTMTIGEDLRSRWVNYTEGITVQGYTFTPVDQAPLNPFFQSFRAQLLQAIEARDVDFLLQHIDEEIEMGYGTLPGKKAFIDSWQLQHQPKQSRIWQHLRDVLELGGIYTDSSLNSYTAPYTFFLQLENPYTQKAIVGTQVRIRSLPQLNSPVIGSLTHQVVSILPYPEDQMPIRESIGDDIYVWERIRTAAGIEGYVFGKYLRSPLDFRTHFTYSNGTWLMTYWISGD